jgi:uncharacterized protein (TIGR01777 family)
MRIAVTGSHGLIGTALVRALGQPVTRVPRGEYAAVAGHDAVVHLAGENIAGRWTAVKKQRIRDSRVEGTRQLRAAMAGKAKVLVCASAIGFYGDRGDEVLTEDSGPGAGFLADVCRDWEAATAGAAERVVNLRFGVVLSARGGALAKMLLPFKLGLGGVVGSGRQWWSWVALDDAVGAILHALRAETLRGPVNVVAPEPVTNCEFTRTLGRALRRPTRLPMPAGMARIVFGEMADAALLASERVLPARLKAAGFQFRYERLEEALLGAVGERGEQNR